MKMIKKLAAAALVGALVVGGAVVAKEAWDGPIDPFIAPSTDSVAWDGPVDPAPPRG